MDRAFRDHASATPQKEAVIDGSLTLTYSQLLAEAESVAAVLRESGLQLKQDEPIGIVIEPSYRHIISQVAVRMLQATCMPFDPASPPERIRGMLDDIGARCVIVQEDLDLGMDLVQIRLDGLSKRMSNPNLSQTVPTENSQKSCVGASERSHILFTSGSTGRPKAVQIMERAILNLAVETSVTPLQGNDRVAELNNPGFDLSLFEIWVPLLSGAGVVVVPRSMITDPANLSSFLVKNKVTVAIVPTALFNILTTTVPDVFRGLRHVIVAGESPNPSIMRNVLQHGPPAHLWNGYGPTECTTVVTMCEVTDEEAQNSRIAIGSPIGNTQVFLLHGDQLAGEGEEGEICVTGPGLSPGYINRSHENAKAFIELTQAALKVGGDANSRVRLYRTGDIGRPRGDRTGCIEYIGRRDNQVKHMGFRVELDEIENILQGHEHVAGAAVVHQAPASSASSSILTAYIMMKQRQSWNPVELRRFVQKHFPFFMIPTRFEEVLEFPLTPNGKLDRRELVKQTRELPKNTFRTDQGVLNQRPKAAVTVMNGTTPDIKKHSNGFTNHDHTREVREMYPEALQGDQESSANSRPHYIKRNQIFSRRPESPGDGVSLNGLSQGRSTEDTIADIWKELLDIAALKESDDFFLLGGTSMQSAALIALIHQRTGRLLTMDEVHANSQFSQLVRFIKGESKGHSCPSSEQVEQWLRDTELGQDVGIVPNWDSPDEGRVFLTGATGFLGSYLLRQLIENPNVEQVACLVRSKDSESAPRRLQKALSKYDLWPVDYELSRKIRVLEGSLAEPSLGLDRDTFRWLTNWASVVFHVGAKVNFCEGYQEHYRDNILGTRHALEVAIRGRRKSFQYVSSLDVWGPTGFILGTKQVKEDDPLIRHFAAVRYDTGYSQSQWVAESIVQQVQAQGLPVAIYRPGFILGHSQTGAGNPGDVIGRLIMGCIKLGEFPRIMNKRFEYIPVDHVVGAILHIASSTANLGSAYHLVPSDQTISPTMNDTYTLLRELGYQLKLVDFNEWLEDVVVSTGSLAPVLPLLREKALGQFTRWEVSQHSPRYDCSNTLRALNASNKKGLGSITADMLGRYIAFWKRKGFFES